VDEPGGANDDGKSGHHSSSGVSVVAPDPPPAVFFAHLEPVLPGSCCLSVQSDLLDHTQARSDERGAVARECLVELVDPNSSRHVVLEVSIPGVIGIHRVAQDPSELPADGLKGWDVSPAGTANAPNAVGNALHGEPALKGEPRLFLVGERADSCPAVRSGGGFAAA
jgi:hypothetical protein